jgi:hypothetical protein
MATIPNKSDSSNALLSRSDHEVYIPKKGARLAVTSDAIFEANT